ncbi:MAG: hypothetical protein MJZ68_01960 [archaeon]|nr:hypothetical protein [archaeon]
MSDEMVGAEGPSRSPAAQKKFDTAMKAMDVGDFKKAYTSFKKFTEEFPDDAEGWYCKAECGNYASGMFGAKVKEEEIIAAYTKAIELDDSRPDYYQSYGSFSISIGKYEEAEKAYNEAAQIDESLSSSLYSEFAIEYYNHVLGTYGEIMDDPKARAKYAKKALEYMLKALDMDVEEAKSLL